MMAPLEPFLLQPVQPEIVVAGGTAMGGAIAAMGRFIVKLMEQRSANEVERVKADFATAQALQQFGDHLEVIDGRLSNIEDRVS